MRQPFTKDQKSFDAQHLIISNYCRIFDGLDVFFVFLMKSLATFGNFSLNKLYHNNEIYLRTSIVLM